MIIKGITIRQFAGNGIFHLFVCRGFATQTSNRSRIQAKHRRRNVVFPLLLVKRANQRVGGNIRAILQIQQLIAIGEGTRNASLVLMGFGIVRQNHAASVVIIRIIVEFDFQLALAVRTNMHIRGIENNLIGAALRLTFHVLGADLRRRAVQAHYIVRIVLGSNRVGGRRRLDLNLLSLILNIGVVLGRILVEILDRHLNVQRGLAPNGIVSRGTFESNLGAGAQGVVAGGTRIRRPAVEHIFRMIGRRSQPIAGGQHNLVASHHGLGGANLFVAVHEGSLHGVAPQGIEGYRFIRFFRDGIGAIIIERNSFAFTLGHIDMLRFRPAEQNMVSLGRVHGQGDLFACALLNFGGSKRAAIGIQLNRHHGRQLLPNGIQGHSLVLIFNNGVGVVHQVNVGRISEGFQVFHRAFRPAQELILIASQGGQNDHITHAGIAFVSRHFVIVAKGNGHLGRLGLPGGGQGDITLQLNGLTGGLYLFAVVNLPASKLLLFIGRSKGALGQGVGGTPCCFSCTLVRIIVCN